MMRVGRFFQIALLILIAAGAQPAYSAFWQWSKTSSSNATADPSINWSEGMSPSSVNDSARAMMARAAEYRDDVSGLVGTAGTSAAYTATSNQGFNSVPNDGQLFAFTPHVTNVSAASLRVDGGTVYQIQTASGVPVGDAVLIAGTPYTVKFSAADNAWRLRGYYGTAFEVPLGALMPYTGNTPPNSNFVFPAGQCLSTSTYATYWALLGSPGSGGCPGGQFAIVDLRGRTLVALDNLNGTPALRLTSGGGCGSSMNAVGATCGNGLESKNFTIANLSPFTPTGTFSASLASGNVSVPQQGNSGVGSPVTSAFSQGANNLAATVLNVAVTGSVSGNVSMSSLGSGTAASTVDPNIAVTYILRVR
jgi:hypothetical protein